MNSLSLNAFICCSVFNLYFLQCHCGVGMGECVAGLSYLEGRGDWVLVGVGDRTRSGLEQTELCWLGYRPGIGIVHENANSVAVKLTF